MKYLISRKKIIKSAEYEEEYVNKICTNCATVDGHIFISGLNGSFNRRSKVNKRLDESYGLRTYHTNIFGNWLKLESSRLATTPTQCSAISDNILLRRLVGRQGL